MCGNSTEITSVTAPKIGSSSTKYKFRYKWINMAVLGFFHLITLYAHIMVARYGKWNLYFFTWLHGYFMAFGITAGVHRLWTHRSYKAKLPLNILLMVLFTSNGHGSIFNWVRDHRVHHKFSETDADPHNAKRGFFFAHVGWLMVFRHPDVLEKGKQIDMSDILNDSVIRFNKKQYYWLSTLLCYVFPVLFFRYIYGEDYYWSILLQCCRYTFILNLASLVNSAAHIYGCKPYDKNIGPTENRFVSLFSLGEGWHNYHHSFPWDYKTSELPYFINPTTIFLEFFRKIGWAYDFKTASPELVRKIIEKHGDGTHFRMGHTIVSEDEFCDVAKM